MVVVVVVDDKVAAAGVDDDEEEEGLFELIVVVVGTFEGETKVQLLMVVEVVGSLDDGDTNNPGPEVEVGVGTVESAGLFLVSEVGF